MENEVLLGDCAETLKKYPAETFDCIVTDPPYGYNFMGKSWDKALPSLESLKECCRVLKSGAFAFFMSAPRQDVLSRMIIRLEEAGFQTGFTGIYWCYATGFLKASEMSKRVDKRGGKMLGEGFCNIIKAKRIEKGLSCIQLAELGGFYGSVNHGGTVSNWETGRGVPTLEQFNKLIEILDIDSEHPVVAAEREVVATYAQTFGIGCNSERIGKEVCITLPATPEAQNLNGSYSGFSPKPATEIIIVAMKRLSERTYVDQALKNGHGVTWLDNCRIPCEAPHHNEAGRVSGDGWTEKGGAVYYADDRGRLPANLLVSDDCLNDGKLHKSGDLKPEYNLGAKTNGIYGEIEGKPESVKGDSGSFSRYFDLDAWFKSKLPEQAQQTYPYMIVPKPSKSEKNKYCENKHPTVKPLKLMSYLITMGSREGDLILDPFAGSGTTLEAARLLNRKFVGCELTEEYKDIIEARAGVSITTDPYRNLIKVTEQNELTIDEMERSLDQAERERYEDFLIEVPYEAFDIVRKAYWMGKGVRA